MQRPTHGDDVFHQALTSNMCALSLVFEEFLQLQMKPIPPISHTCPAALLLQVALLLAVVLHDQSAAGLFQVALSLAVVQWEGRRLSQRLEAVIEAMVTACVQKQLDTGDVASGPASTSTFSQGPASQGTQIDANRPVVVRVDSCQAGQQRRWMCSKTCTEAAMITACVQ